MKKMKLYYVMLLTMLLISQCLGQTDPNTPTDPNQSPANNAPVAHAGGPYMALADACGEVSILLDGTGSYDPDPNDYIVLYQWEIDGDPSNGPEASGAMVNWLFALGTTEISLVVTDADGLQSEPDSTMVTVTGAVGETPILEWSQTYSGYGEAEGHGLAVTSDGIYLTGRTSPVQTSNTDLFLNRYDLDGNPDWDRTWGGSIWDGGGKVAVTGSQVYVAGYTYSYANDPVGGTESDGITVKYSIDGVLDTSNSSDGWWTRFSGDGGYYGYDDASDLAIDDMENLFVLGDSEHAFGNWYRYTEQYDSSGIKQWHQHYGNDGTHIECRSSGLALAGGNLYTVGRYEITAFGPYDLLVQKYNTSGTSLWNYPWGGTVTYENGLDVAVSGNDIYVTGVIGQSGDTNGQDILLLKLHDEGTSVTYVESTTFAGTGDDIGKGIAVADGKIYIVGSTVSGGNSDAILLVYDTDLNLLGCISWGGPEDDVANDVVFSDGKIYVAGTAGTKAFVNAYLPGSPECHDMLVDINPDTINIASKGNWVTVYITLPDGYDVDSIIHGSIKITSITGDEDCGPWVGELFADIANFTPQVGDRDEDMILDLTVKFDRQILQQIFCLKDVTISVECEVITGEQFCGSDTIRVIQRVKK